MDDRQADQEPCWTVQQLAKHWRVDPDTVRARITEGQLPAFTVGKKGPGSGWRVHQSAKEEFEARNPVSIKDKRGRPRGDEENKKAEQYG